MARDELISKYTLMQVKFIEFQSGENCVCNPTHSLLVR